MSWKKILSLAQRVKFVKLALKAQQGLTQLCRVFRISRPTGYKWISRYEQEGLRGLRDRTHRPHRCPNQLSPSWRQRIRGLRRLHPSWGAKKLRASLCQEYRQQEVPAVRTIAKWLSRMKLVRRGRRRSRRGPQLCRRALTVATRSNHVWTVDFKGWFRTQDGQRVEPLTVRDLFSRYLLSVRLLRHQDWCQVRRIFLRLFRQYGYPEFIRMDNGSPFGSAGPAGLSRLSAWWTALGIRVEFIAPGHPEQNGGHEQMHGVMKAETTRPASRHLRAQQRRTDRWVKTYNTLRPHEALEQRPPAKVYQPQPCKARSMVLEYRKTWAVRRVRSNGQIRWRGRKRFVGEAFTGYPVGLRPVSANRWEVYFADLLIGELWQSDPGGIRPATYAPRW